MRQASQEYRKSAEHAKGILLLVQHRRCAACSGRSKPTAYRLLNSILIIFITSISYSQAAVLAYGFLTCIIIMVQIIIIIVA